jgi:ribosome-associated protein
MEDTLLDNKNAAGFALSLGKLLEEHKGEDVIVMDLRTFNAWTDFFVIATATSNAHLQGLERHIKEFSREKDIEILHRSRKPPAGDTPQGGNEWSLIDFGPIVIHLMSANARSFYELERLWGAPVLFRSDHSSKSS